MTKEETSQSRDAAAARVRISEIKDLFEALKQTLRDQVDALPETTAQSPKGLLGRLNELQSTQVLLMKAEEAYYEKYGHDDGQIAIDHDAIRDQIGSKLDRLRDAKGAESVSEGSGAPSD